MEKHNHPSLLLHLTYTCWGVNEAHLKSFVVIKKPSWFLHWAFVFFLFYILSFWKGLGDLVE